jgi:hypothetical protein
MPLSSSASVEVFVDGARAATASPPWRDVALYRGASGWAEGSPAEGEPRKRPGLSGPLTDVLLTCQVHAYGTGVERDTKTLEKAAEQGASGAWTQWAWSAFHPVKADVDVTVDDMRRCSLVLYGDTRSNSILAAVAPRLPIRIEPGAIVVGSKRYDRAQEGTRFIAPNPLAPNRYLVVQAGNSAAAVAAGNNLPDFLPDWVVYDERAARSRPRGIFGRTPPVAEGFFDESWHISE